MKRSMMRRRYRRRPNLQATLPATGIATLRRHTDKLDVLGLYTNRQRLPLRLQKSFTRQ